MSKNVLITGASSGLGTALVKVFSKNGYNTILVSRSIEKLKEIANEIKTEYSVESRPYKYDLTNTKDIDKLLKNLSNQSIKVDILINNAGTGNFGEFINNTDTDVLDIIRLNVVGTTYLTKKILEDMIKSGAGKILNVSSIVGHYPLPYQSVYAATKAYILSFSQSLHSELKDKSIQVSTLCPGNINTDFVSNSGLDELYSKYGDMKKRVIKAVEPDVLAETTYNAFMSGERVIYPDGAYKKLSYLLKVFSTNNLTNKQYKIRKKLMKSE